MTLYELTEDYMNLLELAEDPDIDEQAFTDTLEGIEGALEDKAEGYAKVIRTLEGDAAACDAESKRLRNKKQTIENNIKRMKAALQYAMQATGMGIRLSKSILSGLMSCVAARVSVITNIFSSVSVLVAGSLLGILIGINYHFRIF